MIKKIFIGIDAGRICGLSVWSKYEKKFLSIESCSFWECIEQLERARKFYVPINDYELTVVIEDVTQNRNVFNAVKTYQGVKGSLEAKIGAVAEQAKRVGMVWDKTHLIIEWCEKYNVNLIKVRPSKNSFTKLKAGSFRNLTKWEGKTNEHGRDSACLIFGI